MLDIIDNVDIDNDDIIDIIIAMTSSSAATSRRQFSMVKQRGGVSRMMLLCLPVMATSTCRVFIPNMISEARSALATCLQLGQPSVIPPGLVLEVGGTST